MAGDWIKMRLTLRDDPRVKLVARNMRGAVRLGCDAVTMDDEVTLVTTVTLGALLSLWSVGREQGRRIAGSEDALLRRWTLRDIDILVGVPRFGEWLQLAGFVKASAEGVTLHRFLAYNQVPAMTNAERQSGFRKREKAHSTTGSNASVTPSNESNARNVDKIRLDKIREEKIDTSGNSCGTEPEKPASEPATEIIGFDCVGTGSKRWSLTQSHLDEWGEAFPDLDVLGECRAAKAWLTANGKRKTAVGMPRFLVGWFNRSQNRGQGQSRAGPNGGTKQPISELIPDDLWAGRPT